MAEIRFTAHQTFAVILGLPRNVIHDKEIRVAIIVDVSPCGRHGPATLVVQTAGGSLV
jgi:hypothetical protein